MNVLDAVRETTEEGIERDEGGTGSKAAALSFSRRTTRHTRPTAPTPPACLLLNTHTPRLRAQNHQNTPQVICVESQVLKMQQQQDAPDGADKSKKGGSSGGGTTSGGSSGATSRGGSGGGAGGGTSSRSRTSRNSGGAGSGGGGGGNGGDDDTITFEHEEIVTFEPWMADPKFAALGRLEGITLEVRCGAAGVVEVCRGICSV